MGSVSIYFILGIAGLFILAIFAPKTGERPSLKRILEQSTQRMHSTIGVDPADMQILLSLILLGSGLYVILSHEYDATDKHWAYGTVGTLVGFWLRPMRKKPN